MIERNGKSISVGFISTDTRRTCIRSFRAAHFFICSSSNAEFHATIHIVGTIGWYKVIVFAIVIDQEAIAGDTKSN